MTNPVPVAHLDTAALSPRQSASLRRLFRQAWSGDEGFTDDDWQHAMGGMHFILEEDGEIVSHASVVQRTLHMGGRALATGYVEAVATLPSHRRRGLASAVMSGAGSHIDAVFALGALSTGKAAFYERLGWQVWRGPTSVRTEHGIVCTPEEDGSVMVRVTPATPAIDLAAPISCDWRSGDSW